jgi:hypothetical protein
MVDQEKVDTFMTEMARGLGQVASRGGELAQLWQGVDVGVATREGDLLDKGQYLYCKAVVNKVEGELLN